MMRELSAREITAGYDGTPVLADLSLEVEPGRITALIGPNACGKSTLLKTIGRLHPALAGTVVLDGKDIHSRPSREVARTLGILPQQPLAPAGMSVLELVRRGRIPHQRFGGGGAGDLDAITEALRMTNLADLLDRPVDELSGPTARELTPVR